MTAAKKLPPGPALATMPKDLSKVVNGRLQVNLHRGQAQAFACLRRFILVLAGTQGGKTSFGPLWLYTEIRKRGQGDYLVVAPTFPLLSLKLLPEFLKLFDKQLHLGKYTGSPAKKFVFSDDGARRTLGDKYDPDGPKIVVLFGHAQDADSLESATVKAAWLDEAGQRKFKKASWEAILRRLSIYEGRVLLTTTPYYIGWLKTQLYDKGNKPGGDIAVIQFRSVDNPAFPRKEYEDMRHKLPAWKHLMFYDGIFTRPAGLIYDCYDEAVHSVPRFPVPAHWARVWGFDFGAVNTVCVKLARDPDEGIWYVYAVYAPQLKRTAAQHAAEILEGEPEGIQYRAVGGAASEDNWRAEFTQAGLEIEQPPVREVEVGIDRVYGLIQSEQMKFFDDLAGLVGGETEAGEDTQGELATYSRVVDDGGEPTEEIEDKNKFHLLDGIRYAATLIEQQEQGLTGGDALAMMKAAAGE